MIENYLRKASIFCKKKSGSLKIINLGSRHVITMAMNARQNYYVQNKSFYISKMKVITKTICIIKSIYIL